MFSDPTKAMDSREIALRSGKTHTDVCRDIETGLGQLPGGVRQFSRVYRSTRDGKLYRHYVPRTPAEAAEIARLQRELVQHSCFRPGQPGLSFRKKKKACADQSISVLLRCGQDARRSTTNHGALS